MPTPLELVVDPASLIVFALYAALFLWETLFPARTLPVVPGWKARGALAFVAFFFISAYLPMLLGPVLAPARLLDLSGLGAVPAALVALLVYELLSYGWHRAMHASPFLWRVFHQMHHSAERLDVPSAFFMSPLDMVGFTVVSTIVLALVGLSAQATMLFLLASTFLSIFQHANVRTPYVLGYLVQRPESHSHHHARAVHKNNYANVSLFDVLFGTFENHRDFAMEAGFRDGASGEVLAMLACRDVSTAREDAPPITRPSAPNRLRYRAGLSFTERENKRAKKLVSS